MKGKAFLFAAAGIVHYIYGESFDYQKAFSTLPNSATVKNNFTNLQNGSFQFFLTADCLQIIEADSPFGIPGNCWAQNPDAPYGLFMLPIHIDEVPDNYTGYPLTDENGYSSSWHLRENEAIVLLGKTPPQCRYFGFTNYLYSRYSSPDFMPDPSLSKGLNQISGRACLPGTENERCEYFASLSDTVNLDRGFVLPQDDKFNTSFAMILSPSITAAQLASQALIESEVPPDRITTFFFPGEDLNLGVETTSDTFTTIMRTAFYDNDDDKVEFFNTSPFELLRMELTSTSENALQEKTLYIPRETGVQDDATCAGLSLGDMKEAVLSLSSLVLSSLTEDKGLDYWEVAVAKLANGEQDTGDDCVALGQRCLADCRDTLYPYSLSIYDRNSLCVYFEDLFCNHHHRKHNQLCPHNHPFLTAAMRLSNESLFCSSSDRGLLTNDDEDTIVVVGVNHHKANMSAYSSLAVYDQTYLWGVTGVGDMTLDGSANGYITQEDLDANPNLVQALPYLYAYKVKRSCDEEEEGVNCISIASDPTPENYQLYIPLAHSIGFAERMYDNPLSHIGPAASEIVMPIQIHIKKRT